MTFEGEVAVLGPLTIGITPSWIWGSLEDARLDTTGYALAADVGIYVEGKPLQGFWVKGRVGYESFEAVFTPNLRAPAVTGKRDVSSAVLGLIIGSTNIFGRDGGFAMSGGFGLGVALAPPAELTVNGTSVDVFYEKIEKIKLMGSLSLGVAY
ncbi:hypothetical protein BE15_12410 [Sorangium cellulosum]|uniref:Outer membrane protein beta-barrel domain-containing protein n=1 Tax=Sorangium cellulosum TaxID=56 RepID=A0A150R2E4_SORCE|nr:hypothetical protein BE15_12410 [Sorangium cellulosum]